MKVKYVEEGCTYVISNHLVAKNSIFHSKKYRKRYIGKIYEYLGSVCDILSVSIQPDQFQIIIRLKERSSFEEYFISKKRLEGIEDFDIPATTYIFSQIMANLQAGIAIHFNRKEGRTGALFARRFSKTLIGGKGELRMWFERLRGCLKFHRYKGRWRSKESRFGKWKGECIEGLGVASTEVVSIKMSSLQGQSKKHPFLSISNQNSHKTPP